MCAREICEEKNARPEELLFLPCLLLLILLILLYSLLVFDSILLKNVFRSLDTAVFGDSYYLLITWMLATVSVLLFVAEGVWGFFSTGCDEHLSAVENR